MKKKITISIISIILIALLAFLISVECINNPNLYSEEYHIKKITRLAEKKINTTLTSKTGFNVEPLYDNSEKLFGFLVNYEPYGYSIVALHNHFYFTKMLGASMYDEGAFSSLQRYKISNSQTSIVVNGVEWKVSSDKNLAEQYPNALWETDNEGNIITYEKESAYQVAGVMSERKYMLNTQKNNGSSDYIPAVKRGDKYLNLISMEEFEYKETFEPNEQAVMHISFYGFKLAGNY